MKQQIFARSIFILFSFFSIQSFAQVPDVPDSFIPMEVSKERDNNLSKRLKVDGAINDVTKLSILQNNSGMTDPVIFYNIDAIKSFKTFFSNYTKPKGSLWIYIVAYDKTKPFMNFKHIQNGNIMLVFSLGYDMDSSYKDYFIINPDDGVSIIPLPAQYKDAWTNQYMTLDMRGTDKLAGTINQKENDNMDSEVTDTKAIIYDYDDIDQIFGDEMEYQAKLSKLTGMEFQFAAYDKDGVYDPDTKTYRYKGRLILQFGFTVDSAGHNVPLYIDNQPGFCDRPGAPETIACPKPFKFMREQFWQSFDKGQLCPPNCH